MTRVDPAGCPTRTADGNTASATPAVPGTHPTAVTLAPTDDWQAALASSVLMAPPIHAPVLLSGSTSLPPATANALNLLAPTGASALNGAQVIRVGDVPAPKGLRGRAIPGTDPYTLAAAIDRYATAAAGKPSPDVVIASGDNSAYAMPAAGWAAESGDPILFVNSSGVPAATVATMPTVTPNSRAGRLPPRRRLRPRGPA